MDSAYSNSSLEQTHQATATETLNADLHANPYQSRAEQKRAAARGGPSAIKRLSNPTYKNLNSHQGAAFEGFKIGLFDANAKSSLPTSSKATSHTNTKVAKRESNFNDHTDIKSSKSIIQQYNNLIKNHVQSSTIGDYEDKKNQMPKKRKNQHSFNSQTAANLQTLSPRIGNEPFYFRKDVTTYSPK